MAAVLSYASHAHKTPLDVAMEYPHRPHTVLPPLSSLSLPGSPLAGPSSLRTSVPPSSTRPRTASPRLHHPRPTHPHALAAAVLSPTPTPPAAPAPAAVAAPSADVYARVYAALRERLAGCEKTAVLHAAEHARGALEARRRSVEEEHQGATAASEQREQQPAKRRRSGNATVVEFYDNPAPVLSSDDEGPSEVKKRTRASPRPEHGTASSRPSHLSSHVVHGGRRRSASHPGPAYPSPPHDHHLYDPAPPRSSSGTSTPRTLNSPPLRQYSIRPTCADVVLPSSHSLPSLLPSAHAQARRAEALHNVVRSFEAVLAVRAEGRRRSSLRDVLEGGTAGPAQGGGPSEAHW
ncbi:hypothetical protein JCM8208_000446 [Rhodotorula glutinis]